MDDRFADFVTRLAAELDDPDVDGPRMAGWAGLSRHHFDRLITAVAGESPTRFRARVLLERAAYRLIGTDTPLLDHAVAAGFGSHEAFTRAFTRAYGVSPSAWRRRPTRFQLDAPNDVHFHPPAGLRLPARERTDAEPMLLGMVCHHVDAVGRLVEHAGRLAPELLDTSLVGRIDGIDGESLRWALSRLIGQLAMWNAAMTDEEYDFAAERDESPIAMRRRLGTTGPQFEAHVRRVAQDGRSDETFVDAFSRPAVVVSYGGMLAHVLYYGGHHRLLAAATLRTLGVDDVPLADPKAWFGPVLGG